MKPILIVMTSHGDKAGHGPTGFYLSEVTHPAEGIPRCRLAGRLCLD